MIKNAFPCEHPLGSRTCQEKSCGSFLRLADRLQIHLLTPPSLTHKHSNAAFLPFYHTLLCILTFYSFCSSSLPSSPLLFHFSQFYLLFFHALSFSLPCNSNFMSPPPLFMTGESNMTRVTALPMRLCSQRKADGFRGGDTD